MRERTGNRGYWSALLVLLPAMRPALLTVLVAVLMAGCAPGCPARDGASDTAPADATDAQDPAAAAAAAGVAEGSATGEGVEAESLPADGPWLAVADLASLGSRQQGRLVAHMQPTDEGTLVVVQRPRGMQVLTRVYVVPDGARPERRLHDMVADTLATGSLRGTHPRVVGMGAQGVLQFQLMEALANAPTGMPIFRWWIAADATDMEGPMALALPEDVRPAGDLGAAAMGDAALLCFSVDAQEASDRADAVVCGLVNAEDPLHFHEGLRIGRDTLMEGLHRMDLLAADESHALLLLWREVEEGEVEALGVVLEREGRSLRRAAEAELAGERYPAAGFRLAADPLGAAAEGRFAYYLPAVGAAHARVGQLDRQGQRLGARRQAPAYSARQERPLFFWTGRELVLLMDATGRHGERTLLRFAPDEIAMSDYISPLGTRGPAMRARLAGQGGGRFGMVVDDPSGRTHLHIFETATVLNPDAEPWPELVNEALQEEFEAQQREKLEGAMRDAEEPPAAATDEEP